MAPLQKSLAQLPHVSANGTWPRCKGWRVQAHIDGTLRTGPLRHARQDADKDASLARCAKTREHMMCIFKKLKDDRSASASSTNVSRRRHHLSQQDRLHIHRDTKRLRTHKTGSRNTNRTAYMPELKIAVPKVASSNNNRNSTSSQLGNTRSITDTEVRRQAQSAKHSTCHRSPGELSIDYGSSTKNEISWNASPTHVITKQSETEAAMVQDQAAASDKLHRRRSPASVWRQMRSPAYKSLQPASCSQVLTKRLPTPTTKVGLRGLNIQWPFSQLMLRGTKTQEVRRYDLGHRKICTANEETWIVETRGLHVKAATDSICNGLDVASRPHAAQIIGTVTFASSCPYAGKRKFRATWDTHRIVKNSTHDWNGKGVLYGWQVGTVRALKFPIPVGSTGMTGFGTRIFEVEFES